MNIPRTRFRFASLIAMAMVCVLLIPPAAGDQSHPRLDALFPELKTAPDQEAADAIAAEIWRLWRDIDDPVAAQALASGSQAMGAGQYRNAYQYFSEVIQEVPAFAEGWNKRATVLYLIGAYQESIEDIRETLQREPRHFGALSGLGLIFLRQRQFGPAAAAFRNALAINPHLPRIRAALEQLESRQRSIDEKNTI
jgi:tetratricopeptide (TPR) repeat protein